MRKLVLVASIPGHPSSAYGRRAQDASADHPYLYKKRIKPNGLRIRDGLLLVPMYDPNDEHQFVNLQYVHADGSKWFLKYGLAKGCYFQIGNTVTKRVVVAEGVATGAAVDEANNDYVVIAFSAGNLASVATMIRAELRHTDSVIWRAHALNNRFQMVSAREFLTQ